MSAKDDSGQLYTLEGLAAAAVLLLAMTYALNSFVVTPTADVNPGADTNQKVVSDLLAVSEDKGELRSLLLNWNTTQGAVGFENSTDGVYYYEGQDPDPDGTEFGSNAHELMTEEGITYNVEATFRKPDGGTGVLTVVDNGEPGTSAVTASENVVLLEDNKVVNATGTVNVSDTEAYPIPEDPSRESDVYNQATVRITAW